MIRMHRVLRQWVGYEVDAAMDRDDELDREAITLSVLTEFVRSGNAERYVRRDGKIAWRATKKFIEEIRTEELEGNEVDEQSHR